MYGITWYGIICNVIIWYDIIGYGMVLYGIIWYMIWYMEIRPPRLSSQQSPQWPFPSLSPAESHYRNSCLCSYVTNHQPSIYTCLDTNRNSQPSEGSNFGSLVGTFGQKSEMECHCDSHHWEATERGPKCDLFWRGFAKCSSFTLLPVHTGSFVFPQTPSPMTHH